MAAKWPPSRAGLSQRCVASCQQWTAAAIAATRVATGAAAFMRASGSGTAPVHRGPALTLALTLASTVAAARTRQLSRGALPLLLLPLLLFSLFVVDRARVICNNKDDKFLVICNFNARGLGFAFLLMRVTSSTPSPSPSPSPALFLFLPPSPPHLRWHLQRKSVHE